MKHRVVSAMGRPHLISDPGLRCWCHPSVREVGGVVVVSHRDLELAPDWQPRMACFSDSRGRA